MTRVILTVGTNPVPVLVAAHRLAKHFLKPDSPPPELVLLHTAQTALMADAVKTALEAKLNADLYPPLPTVQPEEIDADGDPAAVLAKVRALATGAPNHYHLHYTGGRKSMGIKAMQALIDVAGIDKVSDSYLDVSSHVLLDDTGRFTGVADERESWNLNLRQLLELHDYTLDFRLWLGVKASFGNITPREAVHHNNEGEPPLLGWLDIAVSIFSVLKDRTWGRSFSEWRQREQYLDMHKWPRHPDPFRCPTNLVRWADAIPTGLPRTDPKIGQWNDSPAAMNTFFGDSPWDTTGLLVPSRLGPAQLELLVELLNNSWLELAAFYYFRLALQRRNRLFNIYYSFRATRTPINSNRRVTRQFEVDVLAILGYQAVLVSCTASAGEDVKTKAFEALHRAHQIGGDGSRAIVLCSKCQNETQPLEEELHHETGDLGRALRIWPWERWQNLEAAFNTYLNEIGWR